MRKYLLLIACCAGIAMGQDVAPDDPGVIFDNPLFNGPSVFDVGSQNVGRRGAYRMPLRFYAGISSSYDSELTGFGLSPTGDLEPKPSFGLEASLGVQGQRRFRRALLGINYGGSYDHYFRRSFFDGTNQSLNLGYTVMLNRRWSLQNTVIGGISNRAVGGTTPFLDTTGYLAVPRAELFDSRYSYLEVRSALTFHPSARLVYSIGGNGSTIHRKANSLANVNAYGFTGSVSYRFDRRSTVGVAYNYLHYDYRKIFGESDVHSVSLQMSRQLNEFWFVTAGLTGYHQETTGVGQVTLDPVIAAILGQTSAYEVFDSSGFPYGYLLNVTYRKNKLGFTASAERGINNGNGLFLTSTTDNYYTTVSYTSRNRWNAGVNAGYSSFKGLTERLGSFGNYNAGMGLSRKLSRSLYGTLRADYRHYNIGDVTFKRNNYRFSLGVTYSPGEGRFALF